MVISVLNEKGGSGKTTVATNLASAWHRQEEMDVVLVDSDPQRSALDWSQSGGPANVKVVHPGDLSLEETIPKAREQFDAIVIDGAPRLSELAIASVKVSDLVIIPVHHSTLDTRSSGLIVEMCDRFDTPYRMMASKRITGTRLAKRARDGLEDLGPVLDSGTDQRVAYIRAINIGGSVFDVAGADKAQSEIESLSQEILELLR